MGRELAPDATVRVLDCVGLYCPAPVMNTREAMSNLAAGEILEVIADDPAAEEDIPRWARRVGHAVLRTWEKDNELHFLIKKKGKE